MKYSITGCSGQYESKEIVHTVHKGSDLLAQSTDIEWETLDKEVESLLQAGNGVWHDLLTF